MSFFPRKSFFCLRTVAALLILIAFSASTVVPPSYAQSILNLPVPCSMVMPTNSFVPTMLKGITIHPDNPLAFDFIIDNGNTAYEGEDLQNESSKIIKYFLASLTIPEKELWVNLSPNEKDRIIPDALGQTELGQDLLAQDYLLKQLTASLMYPEDALGRKFWDKVYQRAQEKYGTTDIPIDTFNKVWIIPESASVYEHENTVYVTASYLKVLTDYDYQALDVKKNGNGQSLKSNPSVLSSEIIKEIIVPAIEKEVNEGENFAPLRQIYQSLILAKWYKETLKDSILSRVYADQKKISGIENEDPRIKEKIYSQYMEAYKKGVYDYMREDYDAVSNEIVPRKYFSGGFKADVAMAITHEDAAIASQIKSVGDYSQVEVTLQGKGKKVELDEAMVTAAEVMEFLAAHKYWVAGAGAAAVGVYGATRSVLSTRPWAGTVKGAREIIKSPTIYPIKKVKKAIKTITSNEGFTPEDIRALQSFFKENNLQLHELAEGYLMNEKKVEGYISALPNLLAMQSLRVLSERNKTARIAIDIYEDLFEMIPESTSTKNPYSKDNVAAVFLKKALIFRQAGYSYQIIHKPEISGWKTIKGSLYGDESNSPQVDEVKIIEKPGVHVINYSGGVNSDGTMSWSIDYEFDKFQLFSSEILKIEKGKKLSDTAMATSDQGKTRLSYDEAYALILDKFVASYPGVKEYPHTLIDFNRKIVEQVMNLDEDFDVLYYPEDEQKEYPLNQGYLEIIEKEVQPGINDKEGNLVDFAPIKVAFSGLDEFDVNGFPIQYDSFDVPTDMMVRPIMNRLFARIKINSQSLGLNDLIQKMQTENNGKIPFWPQQGIDIVLRELLLNTNYHADNAGFNVFSGIDTQGRYFIAVRDFGEGLGGVEKEKLFEKSYTTKPGRKDAGTGLYLSREFIRKVIGGGEDLYAYDNQEDLGLGGGATFKIVIPFEGQPHFLKEKMKEFSKKDTAMATDSTDAPGGIDMNAIPVERQGAGADIRFDAGAINESLINNVEGFSPVIINITPINNIYPLLGLTTSKKEEDQKKITRVHSDMDKPQARLEIL